MSETIINNFPHLLYLKKDHAAYLGYDLTSWLKGFSKA